MPHPLHKQDPATNLMRVRDMPMTERQEIEQLLSQVPREALPQVAGFLRVLAGGQAAAKPALPAEPKRQQISIAQQTFGLIPASAALVRQVLAEDLYDPE
jgi:hypothetical protein